MYTVEFAEHFEDWYWASNGSERFRSFKKALQSLLDNCLDLISDISPGEGIDQYIAQNHQDDAKDDPAWDIEYSKGFWLAVEIDGVQVVGLHLDYKPETSSVSDDISIDVDEDKLTPSQLSKVQQTLDTIRGALVSKATNS